MTDKTATLGVEGTNHQFMIALRREKSHSSPPGGIAAFSIRAASAKAQAVAAATIEPQPVP